MVVVFFAGSAVYLWLALNDIPYFRLEDIEPSLLIHGLVTAQGGGYNFALLFVSFFWGGGLCCGIFVFSTNSILLT